MDRFTVTYRVVARNEADAQDRAAAIALEDTLEIPRDVVPEGYIEDFVMGRVASVVARDDGAWAATVAYHIDAVGHDFAQLMNVTFGNASILPGVRVTGIAPDAALQAQFPGARFGAAGLRALTGRAKGGYVCPVIKPQGSDVATLARQCYLTARAGADIVKEDHGLAGQDAAPFRARTEACADAVARANAERAATGDPTRALYFANIHGPTEALLDMAHHARAVGAQGLLTIPGITGFGLIDALARDIGLPIMAHPSHIGPYVLSPDQGYDHGTLMGTMMRLAGADISVFPNHGGRFGFTKAQCAQIVAACADPDGPGLPILPSPGGGMTLDRLGDMRQLYGCDCVYLLGGSLLRLGDRIGEGVAQMRAALDA